MCVDNCLTYMLQSLYTSFVDYMCYFCLVFVMLSRLFIAALWSPAGKGLKSWLLFVMSNCDFFTCPCDILGQVWNLIVLIPDLCPLAYFVSLQGIEIKKHINLIFS